MAYDVSIIGTPGDTLAAVSKLSVTIAPGDLLRGRITVNRVFLENGCFNFVKEGEGRYSNINRILNFEPKPDSLRRPVRLPDMSVRELTLRNMRFSMVNPAKDTAGLTPGRINFRNMHVSSINARLNRIRIQDNTIRCRIRDICADEISGYRLEALSGDFFLGPDESRIDGLRLMDSYSDIRAGYLSFGYQGKNDLKDFVHKIRLGADFQGASLDFRSLGFFAEGLRDNGLRLTVSGEVKGPVCDLGSDDLAVQSGDSTDIRLRARITGLPDIENTVFDVGIERAVTVSGDISDIVSDFSGKDNGLASLFEGTLLTLNASAYGTLHDMHSEGSLVSSAGMLSYNAGINGSVHRNGMRVYGSLSAESLDIGNMISNNMLGETDLRAGFRAIIRSRQQGGTEADLDSIIISRLTVKGYEYRDIAITGKMRNQMADIRLVSHDLAFPTMFQGIVNMDEDNRPERVRIFMDVPYADLISMNIVNDGDISTLGITANADLRLTDKSILGSVLLDNISYANDNGDFHLDSLYVRSAIMEGKHIVSVKSPVLHADYSSTDSPARLAERFKASVRGKALAGLLDIDTSITNHPDGHYNFHLQTYDVSDICGVMFPGLDIADNTTLDVMLSDDNTMDVKLKSSSVHFMTKAGKEYSVDGLLLSASNPDSVLNGLLSVGRISSGGMIMDNVNLFVGEMDSTMRIRLSFNNADTTYLDFSSDAVLGRNRQGRLLADIGINSSEVNIRGHRWLLPPSSVHISGRYCNIENFRLVGDNNELRIDGIISEDPESKLSVSLDNMGLSVLNSFTRSDLGLDGYLSGDADLYNFFDKVSASMKITGENLSIFGKDLGNLTLLSRRDINRDRFNVLINNYIDGRNPINVSGYYVPGRNYMNMDMSLSGLSLEYLSPILNNILSVDSGTLSGNILITGQPDRIMLSSDNTRIDSVMIKPSYTQVPYMISGPITMNQRSIGLNGISITDPRGSKAVLNGSITHSSFRDMYLDATLSFNDLMCLNTKEKDNSKFYGSAFASGSVAISGYTDDLLIDADVRTEDNSAIHIPLSSSSFAATTDLISYTDFRIPEDSAVTADGSLKSGNTKKKNSRNLEIRARADIDQGTELLIEMNKQLGDILRCTGDGEIELNLNPSRNITDLRGDYTIADGSYHFAMSIQSRDFTLNEGGTISFNGDFKNTVLNVGATYSTKASISTLIADTTSVGNRRTVNCGIQLQGSLSNPELSFTIDIPDLDPITKGRVEGALSTPDKVQKQFLALLISGSFVPDEQSGIVNNSTILYSNASEILSNQFNNIFRQLDIPLDLGLNYQPGVGTGGKDMFDVAISYQAFNNRLIINGNVGNSETSSNWAGDFDAEIKVDKQGKLRITLFTRSADSYSNYLDNTQRSGLGITYQDEFDTFGDFWRNIFFSRKRKEQYELELMREAEEELEREAAEANIVKENVQKPREDPFNFLEDSGYTEYSEE
ncbi:MAG TPA: translocation/assembly module TamB [Candidatus Coprenecus pullistercoris]|nr:translocation/assembly module TamB [Candidatus Coprenecus pullistercoris]